MKFRKFGKALLIGALSVGAVLGVTSCVQSYTVGFLFVTGTSTAGTGEGIVSGFKIDHNTGNLIPINGMPVASGGANPGRAILAAGSRFVYVLNRGTDPATNGPCTAATIGCNGANISQFAVGGTGVLAFQAKFFTQGLNPFRLIGDAGIGVANKYIYALDAEAPSATGCEAALGPSVTTCGDITAFQIDQSTGRLTLLVNAQVSTATGSQLPYFPVPADPIDMTLAAQTLFTLSGTPATGDVVFPYSYNGSTGQLTITQNSAQPINGSNGPARQATAIATTGGVIYVLDDESVTIPAGDVRNFAPGVYLSQIIPFTAGSGGSLQAQTGGVVPDDSTQSNPILLIGESKTKWVYVANQGVLQKNTNETSGIVGYIVDRGSGQLLPMPLSPFSTGSGPQCLLEDPSNSFFYTANFIDSSVSGRALDANGGELNPLPGKAANASFKLEGPAAWCLVSGRTS